LRKFAPFVLIFEDRLCDKSFANTVMSFGCYKSREYLYFPIY